MRLIKWGGLRAEIIAWSFVPTAIILAAVALVGFYAYQQVTQDLSIESSREVARLSAGELAAELSDYSNSLAAVARTAALYDANPADRRDALAQSSNRLIIFDGGVLLLDNYGTVIAAQPPRPEILGQDWSGRDYFRQMVRMPATVYSNVVNDGLGRTPVVVVAVPVTNARGEWVGTLAGMFRVGAASVSSFYGSIVKLHVGVNDSAYLVDQSGRVIYHSNEDWIGRDLSAQPVVQQVNSGKADALRTRDPDGREIVASFAPVPGTPWGLVTEQSWEVLLAPGQRYGQFLLLLLVLGLVLPAVVVTIGVQRITEPINRLIAAAKEVAGGNLGRTTTIQTGDEIEELSQQFNRMSVRLAESYAALKAREERLALLVEGTNDGIWDWDLATNEVYCSPRWKAMLGYQEEELDSHFDGWRGLMHPDDFEPTMAELQACLQGQKPVYQMEHRLRHKDGSYRWILARGITLRDADGKPYRMAGSHTDITARKYADEAIRQSEKRFSQVFRASPIPISITALEDGRLVEVNDAWLRLFEYTREQAVGSSSLELNIWAEPEQRAKMMQDLQTAGSVRDFEHLARTRSGQVRNVLVSAEVIELNNTYSNLSLFVDITERKQAEQALERRVAERTHELATLNSIAEVVSETLDLKEIMNAALSQVAQSMQMDVGAAYSLQESTRPDEGGELVLVARYGLSDDFAQRVTRRPLRGSAIQVAAAELQPQVWQVNEYPDLVVKQVLEREGVRQAINVPLFAKGKLVGAFSLGTRRPRSIAPEEISLLAAIGREIAVAVENARLYDQAEQTAALEERHRLSRELHDSVTQSLYSMTLYAEAIARLLESGEAPTATEHLRELRDTAQEALREMRLLIFQLRLPVLGKSGLVAALQERIDSVERRSGLQCRLHVVGEERLPDGVQEELYHIAQEALNNVLKHARAKHVQIDLLFLDDALCLEIVDDGVGFDPEQSGRRGGLGLCGMQERAKRIGGQLEIVSAPGKGTRVTLQARLDEGTPQAEDTR